MAESGTIQDVQRQLSHILRVPLVAPSASATAALPTGSSAEAKGGDRSELVLFGGDTQRTLAAAAKRKRDRYSIHAQHLQLRVEHQLLAYLLPLTEPPSAAASAAASASANASSAASDSKPAASNTTIVFCLDQASVLASAAAATMLELDSSAPSTTAPDLPLSPNASIFYHLRTAVKQAQAQARWITSASAAASGQPSSAASASASGSSPTALTTSLTARRIAAAAAVAAVSATDQLIAPAPPTTPRAPQREPSYVATRESVVSAVRHLAEAGSAAVPSFSAQALQAVASAFLALEAEVEALPSAPATELSQLKQRMQTQLNSERQAVLALAQEVSVAANALALATALPTPAPTSAVDPAPASAVAPASGSPPAQQKGAEASPSAATTSPAASTAASGSGAPAPAASVPLRKTFCVYCAYPLSFPESSEFAWCVNCPARPNKVNPTDLSRAIVFRSLHQPDFTLYFKPTQTIQDIKNSISRLPGTASPFALLGVSPTHFLFALYCLLLGLSEPPHFACATDLGSDRSDLGWRRAERRQSHQRL